MSCHAKSCQVMSSHVKLGHARSCHDYASFIREIPITIYIQGSSYRADFHR